MTGQVVPCPFCGYLLIVPDGTAQPILAHYTDRHPRRYRRLLERGR